jgi:hypothetical protein
LHIESFYANNSKIRWSRIVSRFGNRGE